MGIVSKEGQSIQTDGTTVNVKDRPYFKKSNGRKEYYIWAYSK